MKSSSTLTPSLTYLLLLVVSMVATTVHSQPRYPNCTSKCGNYTIDYPFGIGRPECYLTGFQIQCINDTVPVLAAANRTIDQFRMSKGQVVLRMPKLMAFDCENRSFSPPRPKVCLDLPPPFTISARSNKFMALGCDTLAVLTNNDSTFNSSCQTLWSRGQGRIGGGGGLGNCQSALPEGTAAFCYSVGTVNNYADCAAVTRCSFAAVAAEWVRYPNESALVAITREEAEPQPLVVDWDVNSSESSLGGKAGCVKSNRGRGYLCSCVEGYTGNPYLNDTDTGSCTNNQNDFPSTAVAIAGGFTLVLTFAMGSYIYNLYFPGMEGGAVPAVALSGPGIPTLEDLQRIYKVGCISRKLYALMAKMREKGPLVEYMPLIVEDLTQIEPFKTQFTAFRTWVRHPNVVRPYRCNLEDRSLDDAMLVYYKFYEHNLHTYLHDKNGGFTDNGTSSIVIDDDNEVETKGKILPWKDRLRVAAGTAKALACAHSQGYLHRDVRSSNILMDSKRNAKLIQFGVAMLMTKETYMKETRGYTDPEFIETSFVTYKSDVYGLGVLLVELLTGKDPSVDVDGEKGKGVVTRFLLSTDDEIDAAIREESSMDELIKVVRLTEECLRKKGEMRPTMIEAVEVLNSVIRAEHPDMDLNDNLYEDLKNEALETSMDLAVEGEGVLQEEDGKTVYDLITGSWKDGV